MGEFLLSILGFDAEGEIVFARKIKNSRYTLGQRVPIFYPHGANGMPYYRIYNKPFSIEVIKHLVVTGDPNMLMTERLVPYQRELRDAEIWDKAMRGVSLKVIASQYKGWIVPAVMAALDRHKARLAQKAQPPQPAQAQTQADIARKEKVQAILDMFGDDNDEENYNE